ncbi:class I SAM-dependent methyltransferase [Herminiimonas fonticola]|nr:class I SAM-dependent methyltransferase [Herminiimonas fonticola]
MEVLQNKSQIDESRAALVKKGASAIESPFRSFLRRYRLAGGIVLGDHVKSWDVLASLNFIEKHVQKNESILDIGCYASEIVVALHKSGYKNLTGADLNPDLTQMPYNDSIRYEITNFMQTPFVEGSFKAITSISVIEHGFDGDALLKETSRLLQSGGYFIASFDYWPEKIDTSEIKFFGMDWKIFSKKDVADFIQQAADYGMTPVGELHYEAQETPIECGGKKYTFGWLVLQKTV